MPCPSNSCLCPVCEVLGGGGRSGASVERMLASVGLDETCGRSGQVLAVQGRQEEWVRRLWSWNLLIMCCILWLRLSVAESWSNH